MSSPPASLLPYAQTTAAQRAQVLHYLQARLRLHFPTLPARAFARALDEFRPALLLTGPQLTLPRPDLTQLVQYLASTPELPLLDPPLYGPWALELAQRALHGRELAAATLPELRPGVVGSRLLALLRYLLQSHPLAQRIVQAQRWDLPGSPQLPPGLPGGAGSVLTSAQVRHYLDQLAEGLAR